MNLFSAISWYILISGSIFGALFTRSRSEDTKAANAFFMGYLFGPFVIPGVTVATVMKRTLEFQFWILRGKFYPIRFQWFAQFQQPEPEVDASQTLAAAAAEDSKTE